MRTTRTDDECPYCGKFVRAGEWVFCEVCGDEGCDDCMFDPDSARDICPDCKQREEEEE